MTDKKKFIIGSRGSKLSLAYSGHVKNLLLKLTYVILLFYIYRQLINDEKKAYIFRNRN